MLYFLIALLFLFSYMAFMILKTKFKTTNRIIVTHLIVALLMFASYAFMLINSFHLSILSPLGLVFLALGITIFFLGFYAIKHQAFQHGKKLVTWGIYRHVRHPIYLGMILSSYGFAFSSSSLYPFVYALVLNAMYIFVIKAEEKELERRFGEKYATYKKKVPALVLKIL